MKKRTWLPLATPCLRRPVSGSIATFPPAFPSAHACLLPSPPALRVLPARSTRDDPNFMDTYFRASRLHFIGTWRNRIEALMAEVDAQAPAPAPPGRGEAQAPPCPPPCRGGMGRGRLLRTRLSVRRRHRALAHPKAGGAVSASRPRLGFACAHNDPKTPLGRTPPPPPGGRFQSSTCCACTLTASLTQLRLAPHA